MTKKDKKPAMTDAQVAEKKAAKAAYDRARREALAKLASPTPAARMERPKAKVAKPAKAAKPAKEKKAKRMGALDAAATVLAAAKEPMRAKDLIAQMAAKGLWTSPGGKTPEATLYAAMVREITAKGDKARFKKLDRGVFAAGKGI